MPQFQFLKGLWRSVSRADGKYLYITKHNTCILQQVPLAYHTAALGSVCWILEKFGTAQSCASFGWVNCVVEGDWSHSLGQQMASETHKEAHNVSDCHSDHLFWMGRDTHPTMPWFSPLRARRLEPTKPIGCSCVPSLTKPQCWKHKITTACWYFS